MKEKDIKRWGQRSKIEPGLSGILYLTNFSFFTVILLQMGHKGIGEI